MRLLLLRGATGLSVLTDPGAAISHMRAPEQCRGLAGSQLAPGVLVAARAMWPRPARRGRRPSGLAGLSPPLLTAIGVLLWPAQAGSRRPGHRARRRALDLPAPLERPAHPRCVRRTRADSILDRAPGELIPGRGRDRVIGRIAITPLPQRQRGDFPNRLSREPGECFGPRLGEGPADCRGSETVQPIWRTEHLTWRG